MRYLLVVTILIFCGIYNVDAQMRLKTPKGRIVLLFDNGTWEYEDKINLEEIAENVPLKSIEEISKPIELKGITLEEKTVIKGESAKLAKFIKQKNTVKCDFKLLSDGEKLVLKTNWKILDEEGFRFFGFITKKSKIDLELSNGEMVSLKYSDDFEPKEYPNYGFTVFKSELILDEDQIRALQKAYIAKISMQWSRRMESYAVSDPAYFVEELPKILK